MTVFKVKEKWRAQVFVNGKCVATKSGFLRKSKADRWHDDTKRAFLEEGSPSEHTFEELLEHFKNWHLPSTRPSTRTRYLVDIDQRLEPMFRYMRLSDITGSMIEQAKAKWSTEISPKSVNNCLHTLRLILNRAVKWKMLKENPYAVDSLKVPAKPYVWWSEQEDIQKFLAAAKSSRYYPVYLTALETGMRYGEIVGLSPQDVDLEQGTIHVYRQWLEREGKYGPPKHDKERWIDFKPDGELAQVLRSLPRTGDRLFTTATGAPCTKSGVAHKYFRAAIKRAGVPLICFHGMRHTFASWYMIRHDNVWDLKEILGHADIKTTQRYAHHSKRARRKPLDLASITHFSHTRNVSGDVSIRKHGEKEWRDGRDSNSYTPKIRVVK